MKLSTAAAVLLSTTYGAVAFVPRAPFIPSRTVTTKKPLFMSEVAPTVAEQTYE
jgi:hypothetical protein